MSLRKNSVLHKIWNYMRTKVLTLNRFNQFLQIYLIVNIVMGTNIMMLLRRQFGTGYTPGAVEDWVIMGSSGAEFLLAPVLGWLGRNRRNYALSIAQGLATITSFLVLAVPFKHTEFPYVELCGDGVVTRSETPADPLHGLRTALLVMCVVFCTLARASIFAHGVTYLDDHKPEDGPYYYGILISIRLSLGLSAQGWLQGFSLKDSWWPIHLTISSLGLIVTIIFALFPSQMMEFPKLEDSLQYSTAPDSMITSACYYHNKAGKDELIQMSPNTDDLLELTEEFCLTDPDSIIRSTRCYHNITLLTRYSFFQSLTRIVRNKVVVLQTLALAMLNAAIHGFAYYDKAYVQARYHVEAYRQDPQTSRGLTNIFRSFVIIFFVMIFRIRFSSRRPDGVKANTASRVGGVVAGVITVVLVVLASVSCDIGEIEGVEDKFQQPACSEACGCDSTKYGFSPVCDVDSQSTFFSPCNAGCSDYVNFNGFLIFKNCTCGMERAARGACSISSCRLAFSVYQIMFTLLMAVGGSAFLMQGMAILRSVRRVDKPIVMGVSNAIIALLAFVIGHLLYLVISYLTCAYPDGYTCIFHHSSLWILCACSAALAMGSSALSIYTSKAGPSKLS